MTDPDRLCPRCKAEGLEGIYLRLNAECQTKIHGEKIEEWICVLCGYTEDDDGEETG